jgi:hypothetical protein
MSLIIFLGLFSIHRQSAFYFELTRPLLLSHPRTFDYRHFIGHLHTRFSSLVYVPFILPGLLHTRGQLPYLTSLLHFFSLAFVVS